MKRRSTKCSGWVNFPVCDPCLENTDEGGMVVKLVVCDNRKPVQQFGVCCGASVTDMLKGSFVGDGRRPRPLPADKYESMEVLTAECAATSEWERYHFPHADTATTSDLNALLSRDYLAALVLGTTGWSGWNENIGQYWVCQESDLTPEGKVLYQQFEKLYPDCDIHLLTFLDT